MRGSLSFQNTLLDGLDTLSVALDWVPAQRFEAILSGGTRVGQISVPTVRTQLLQHRGCIPGNAGISNNELTPKFIDAAKGDYHLAPDSPLIDRGPPTLLPCKTSTAMRASRASVPTSAPTRRARPRSLAPPTQFRCRARPQHFLYFVPL